MTNQFPLAGAIQAMTATLAHRGPDDTGAWIDADRGVALGHRRLSILDLSPHGHQPMASASSRYVIVFNGEIYNYLDIRSELARVGYPVAWKGNSDTEVILAAVSCWGLETAVKKLTGMFSFAIWDREQKILSLVRDRLGEKPMYYGWTQNAFIFGSELKALRAHPEWVGEINRDAIILLLRNNYIPAPHSIYQHIYKLQPGTILSIATPALLARELPAPTPYWTARAAVEAAAETPFTGNESEALMQLDTLLQETIKKQMIADVPVGALLSGGIDSSTVVALMQAHSQRPIKTFTVGFDDPDYDESQYGKAIANYLHTDHHELFLTQTQAIGIIPDLPRIYDEPFADTSQIPTFLVSRLARQSVTVCLTGDGGDELFGGYSRYFWGRNIWRYTHWLPAGYRNALTKSIQRLSSQHWDYLSQQLRPVLPRQLRLRHAGDKAYKVARMLAATDPEQFYYRIVSQSEDAHALVIGAAEPATAFTDRPLSNFLADPLEHMMYLDQISYLPDDILVKLDRASMAVSLESRVPFLDHHLVEFAWRLPLHMKCKGNKGKWLLRQLLHQYVPKKLVERPKKGFGIPLDGWLKGPLRDWAESLLSEARLREEGYFHPLLLRQKWLAYLSGEQGNPTEIWSILMFQAWLQAH